MARHPITLLAPAVLCAGIAGFCTGLVMHASPRDADTFVLVGGVGALFFAARAYVEARRAWPQFRSGLANLSAMRRSVPLTRINLPKDDIR